MEQLEFELRPEESKISQGVNENLTMDQNSGQSDAPPMANRTYEESSVWRCLKLDERAVDTRDSDSARRWRCGDVLRKKRGKRKKNGGGEKSRGGRDGEGGGKTGEEMRGCEAAVKRGRVRVGPSQLAGRVDADRESKGWMDGRG